MELEFVREENTNYLKIKCRDNRNISLFQMKMTANNKIPGLLGMYVRTVNNMSEYYYDIKTYKTVSSLYEVHDITVDDAVNIIWQLDKTIGEFDDYFLDRDNILLDPRSIMIDAKQKKAYFVYAPYAEEVFEIQLRRLIEFFLEHMEHCDRGKTVRFYEVYQKVIRGCTDLSEITEKLTYDPGSGPDKKDVQERYIVPDVMNEHIEEESEVRSFDPAKSADVLRVAAVISAAAAVAVQILPGVFFPVIPVGVSIAVFIAGAALYAAGMKLKDIPSGFFTKMIKKDEEIQYSFSASEYDDQDISEENEGERLFNESYDADADDEKNETRENNQTILLSEAVKRKNIIKLVMQGNDSIKNICIESVPCVLGCESSSADIVIDQPFISRIHARIGMSENGECYIQDMFSTNGTFVNGVRIMPERRQTLCDGDIVVLASTEYRVVL